MTEQLISPSIPTEECTDYKKLERDWVMTVLGPALFDENHPQHEAAEKYIFLDFIENFRLEILKTNFQPTLTPSGKEHHTGEEQANIANRLKAGTMRPY